MTRPADSLTFPFVAADANADWWIRPKWNLKSGHGPPKKHWLNVLLRLSFHPSALQFVSFRPRRCSVRRQLSACSSAEWIDCRIANLTLIGPLQTLVSTEKKNIKEVNRRTRDPIQRRPWKSCYCTFFFRTKETNSVDVLRLFSTVYGRHFHFYGLSHAKSNFSWILRT